MNTPEILEKIELHLLRTQRLLQQIQTSQLTTADIEKIHTELRQAYEFSVVLKYAKSANATVSTPVIEPAPEPMVKPLVQPPVEPAVQPKAEPSIQPPVAEVPPPVMQPTPPPVSPTPPPQAPEPRKKPVIPAMTVAEAKVTFNDQKAEVVKEALADKLALSKIADLTKAIALHEKFLFINELFLGDNVPYNEFINKVNQLQTLDEALITINDYAGKYNWDFESKTFQKMLIYIQRRHA
jgi:hypothetical protein